MLIGLTQWAATLGRFDIQYATNTLAKFNICTREGHLKRVLQIFGYLKYHPKYQICFDTEQPNLDGLTFLEHDWEDLYANSNVDIPDNMPPPMTEEVTMSIMKQQ